MDAGFSHSNTWQHLFGTQHWATKNDCGIFDKKKSKKDQKLRRNVDCHCQILIFLLFKFCGCNWENRMCSYLLWEQTVPVTCSCQKPNFFPRQFFSNCLYNFLVANYSWRCKEKMQKELWEKLPQKYDCGIKLACDCCRDITNFIGPDECVNPEPNLATSIINAQNTFMILKKSWASW